MPPVSLLQLIYRFSSGCPSSSAWGQMQETGFRNSLWGKNKEEWHGYANGAPLLSFIIFFYYYHFIIIFSEHGVGLSAVPKYFECFHKHLSGDRDGSVGKVLPKVLISIHSIHVKMPGIVPCACDLSTEALETWESLLLTGHSVLLNW